MECLSATRPKSRQQSVDIRACVDALARVEAIERLPTRDAGAHRAAADTVLCDISLSNSPVGADVATFVAGIQANSRHEIDFLGFSQTIEKLGCGKGPVWSWDPLDISTLGQCVIAVSCLPPRAQRQLEAWRRLAESLTSSGREFVFVNMGETTAASGDSPGLWFTLVS
jgi:hypothetical protein